MLRVLTRLVALEPTQLALLDRIIAGPLIDADALRATGALSDGSAEAEASAVDEDGNGEGDGDEDEA